MPLIRRQGTRSEGGEELPAGSDADKRPVSRVLTASAKGAERVAHVTGIDRAMNQAAEEAIVRALRSPAVVRAIERAIELTAERGLPARKSPPASP